MKNNSKDNKKIEQPNYKIWMSIGFILILIILIGYGLVVMEYKERGSFGDMFGAINALFSGAAFVGIIISMRMQSDELSLQRDELAQTREVLNDQKKQLEQQQQEMALQNETMRKQQFENTFFSLVDLLNKQSVLTNFDEAIELIQNRKSKPQNYRGLSDVGIGGLLINKNYINYSPFGKTLNTLLTFIENDNLDIVKSTRKDLYLNIILSQINKRHAAVICHACLTEQFSDLKKFKDFYESLLSQIDENLIFHEDMNYLK